ncbi:hypothetical protein DEA98_10430 [Brucella pseudogrignonensis]|nr:hypothetical protein [Brucella pseudogrignonensis]MCM0751609.1 hypothetical protein [Brucella pseudogrignonensis]
MRDNTTKFHDILTRYKQVMAEVEQLTLTGRQIKFVRNELGESQMAFAERIGSTQVSVFRAEEKRKNFARVSLSSHALRQRRSSGSTFRVMRLCVILLGSEPRWLAQAT